ncbi:MAG: hypothetical protein CO096_33390 [Armatimonadetes bacterium CG_4_9_14_3_um_filter_66_14]|nr:MAG: hypothetical protein CO096_33390 [Armatimonadetes bacterium CG_4_9_14_3_um_filter_66_14]
MSCVLFDHSPKSERVEEPAIDTSRRDFLRRAGGAAGLGLVHFTILGSLATPAFAETDDDCGTKCPSDQGQVDICTCASGDNTTPPRDVCNCGDENIGGSADVCGCGDESRSDTCNCPDDHNDFPSDACTCDRDNSGADVCECGNDQSLQVDSCALCGEDNDHYHDKEGPDSCTCASEGQAVDACLCWYDGYSCGNEGYADQCDCDQDATGNVDSCACCYEPSVADDCNCPSDHSGSWCYEESANQNPPHSPQLADWCNCSPDSAKQADSCDCKEGDGWTWCGVGDKGPNTQVDVCCHVDPRYGSPSGPSGDECNCPADARHDAFATDYCTCPDAQQAEDVCNCNDDGNHDADVV